MEVVLSRRILRWAVLSLLSLLSSSSSSSSSLFLPSFFTFVLSASLFLFSSLQLPISEVRGPGRAAHSFFYYFNCLCLRTWREGAWRCGAVWRGMVWCGVVRCGCVAWCGWRATTWIGGPALAQPCPVPTFTFLVHPIIDCSRLESVGVDVGPN